jgi:hypothetical protein
MDDFRPILCPVGFHFPFSAPPFAPQSHFYVKYLKRFTVRVGLKTAFDRVQHVPLFGQSLNKMSSTIRKRCICGVSVFLLALFSTATAYVSAGPSSFDLVGRWNGSLDMGKFSFTVNLKIARSDDGKTVKVTLDTPDQGVKDMPIAALLYNHPDVRIEIDEFNTAFNGKLSADGLSMIGSFDEGPGGRPMDVTFKKDTRPEQTALAKSYTLKEGEPPDIRGYWKGAVAAKPDEATRIGLKIGRLADGSFEALMDNFDQGAKDIPATTINVAGAKTTADWKLFDVHWEAALSTDGRELAGSWKQRGKSNAIVFSRVAKPETAMPEGTTFQPEKDAVGDLRGRWNGTLDVGDAKLRLALTLGKAPDGSYAATLVSLDQGPGELLATTVDYTNAAVRIEWKGIHGVYSGNLEKSGAEIVGAWEQGGKPRPLKLVRAEAAAK